MCVWDVKRWPKSQKELQSCLSKGKTLIQVTLCTLMTCACAPIVCYMTNHFRDILHFLISQLTLRLSINWETRKNLANIKIFRILNTLLGVCTISGHESTVCFQRCHLKLLCCPVDRNERELTLKFYNPLNNLGRGCSSGTMHNLHDLCGIRKSAIFLRCLIFFPQTFPASYWKWKKKKKL